jgi:hypothetical protein
MIKPSGRRSAMLHILHSHDHAKAGLIPEAEHHRKKAQQHYDAHHKALSEAEYPETAQKFADEMAPYFEKLDSVIEQAKAAKPPKKSVLSRVFGKSEIDNMTDEELEKALIIIPGTKPAKVSTKVEVDRQPGKDPRYDYKPFHELGHDDQIKATHAFQDKDMGSHHYPVEKDGGAFVHGATRWKQITPQATPEDHKVLVAPEHRAGAYVRINAEGTPHHSKVGIVRMPHPNFPGKVPVQVGIKDHEVEYFEPHEVKLNKSTQANGPILEELVSKGRKVLASIKKGPE